MRPDLVNLVEVIIALITICKSFGAFKWNFLEPYDGISNFLIISFLVFSSMLAVCLREMESFRKGQARHLVELWISLIEHQAKDPLKKFFAI